MIVRILADGQYRVDGVTLEKIKKIDDELMVALTTNESRQFHDLLRQAADLVRQGEALDPAHLVESDLILPAADTTLEEAKKLFSDPE